MLTAVAVTNTRGSTLQLPVMSSASGYTVRDIEGLDPVAATLSTSSQAQFDGAQPQNAQRGPRTVLMKIGLEPANWAVQSVESLRAGLYDYLMPKANVTLGFYKDNALFATSTGQVESFDAPLFVQDPEADISVVCYDPDFYGAVPVIVDGTTRTDQVPTVINYDGTSENGLIFSLLSDRSFSSLQLQNTTPENKIQKMTVAGNFINADNIVINTVEGMREITLIRNAMPSSLMTGYDIGGSTFISLQRGENDLRVKAASAGIPWTLTYTPKYGGL